MSPSCRSRLTVRRLTGAMMSGGRDRGRSLRFSVFTRFTKIFSPPDGITNIITTDMIRTMATKAAAASAEAASSSPIRAGLILSRIPIITQQPTPFEQAYYNYQDELERRLMWTFPQYYYYKKGSLSERKFVSLQRGPAAKQPGVKFDKGEPDIKLNRDRRFKQEIVVPREGEGEDSNDSFTRPIEPNPRQTEADKTNDIKSLIRKLDRTLYLVVNEKGNWKLPSFALDNSQREPLHQAAERGLREIGGPNMHTWTVSNSPCVYYKQPQLPAAPKEFYIKSHIIHGQFKPAADSITDFAWLTKEEVSDRVDSAYFDKIGPVLSHV